MDLPLSFYLVTTIAILITGISKSGFGGGLGVMSVPLMSVFVPPQLAAAVLMPILLAMDIIIVFQYRHHWSRRIVLVMLPGALLGLAIGAASFRWMDGNLIRLIIGILALFFVAQYLLAGRESTEQRRSPRLAVLALGTVSGFASFVAHAGGPPVKGFLLRQNLQKTVFVGTNTMYFFSMNALKTVAYGAMGHYSLQSLTISAAVAPMLLVGIFIGTRLHRIADQQTFTRVVYVFLGITGLKLLSDSVPVVFA